jgi:hypothetical protein
VDSPTPDTDKDGSPKSGERIELRTGDVLAGKYRVERILGSGGMGVVVAAHHIQLDEKVALKFLLPHALRSPEATSRFVREARAAAKIKSEHVARVNDVGALENGAPYMVMEYLEGSDLAHRLEEHGPLPITQTVDFMLQTCEALAAAHALGIVHRDLKPANLFSAERADGQLSIKVLDFGISKITTPGTPGHGMTQTHAVMGTAPYMSPEQMKQSKEVDPRGDIWSLGIILFELLTGCLPFDSEAVTELAIKVASEPAPLLRSLRPDAPAGLESVIGTCLEKDRERRFQTVGELAIALKDFGSKSARASVERVLGTLRKAGIHGAVLPPSGEYGVDLGKAPTISAGQAPVVVSQRATVTATSWGEAGTGNRSRRVVVFLGAAIVIAIIGLGALRASHDRAAPIEGASAAIVTQPQRPDVETTAPEPSDLAAPPPTGTVPTVAFSALPAASVAPAAPPPSPRSVPPVTGATRPTGASSAAPKSGCNPPYVIDSAGHRQYRPECLNY